MRVFARSSAPLLAGLVLVIACSGPTTTSPDPTTVLRQSGEAMAGLHSVSADVKFGSGITVDELTLSSASSKIQLPGESDTIFKVKQGDFLVDLRVVTTNGKVFLRLPFSQFTEVPPDQAKEIPDVSRILDQRAGLPAFMASGKDARYLGTEQMGGVDCDKVTATYTAAQIGDALGGLKPASDVKATIWSGRSDHFARRVILDGQLLEPGKDVQVQVDMHDFNQPVTITKPTT